MNTLPAPANCCTTCDDLATTQIPGAQGPPGADGTNGTDGQPAQTLTTDSFVMPAISSNVTIDVVDSTWTLPNCLVYVQNAGFMLVASCPSTTSLELTNLGYLGNAAPTTVIASGVKVVPTGLKGDAGAPGGGGDMLSTQNLSTLTNFATARSNLGGTTVGQALFLLANPSAVRFIRINALNTVTARTAVEMQADLSLTPGTNVQAFDAFLASIAALGTAANKMIYTTGVDTAAETAITAFARSLIDDADAAEARVTLGKVLPRYGLLAAKATVDLNSAGSDNAVTVDASRYIIDRITFESPSTNLTTATAGVFSAAGGGGVTVAADQSLAALTASTKFKNLTLDAGIGTDYLTAATLYIRNGTAQGGAATANVFIFGWRLDA